MKTEANEENDIIAPATPASWRILKNISTQQRCSTLSACSIPLQEMGGIEAFLDAVPTGSCISDLEPGGGVFWT